MSVLTAHGSPLTVHLNGLRFGDQASIDIARRAAAVAGLIDHIETDHTFPVDLPCADCGGTGDCEDCKGLGEKICDDCGNSRECRNCYGEGDCALCSGTGVNGNFGPLPLIDCLQAMEVESFAEVCEHFEYTPAALGSPFQKITSEVAA